MRIIIAGLIILVLQGCSSAQRVARYDDEKVCRQHGIYWMTQNLDGLRITNRHVQERGIDKEWCGDIANKMLAARQDSYKSKLCESLGLYRFKGAYGHFQKSMEQIKANGFYDQACGQMANYYYIRLRRDRKESEMLKADFKDAPEVSTPTLQSVSFE